MPPKINLNIQFNQVENGFVVNITGMNAQKQFVASDLKSAQTILVDFVNALEAPK